MLALPLQHRPGLIVIGDDTDPRRAYVALDRPRVARHPDGSARLRLLIWKAASGPVSGARLSLDVELQPTAQELAAAGLAERECLPLPWTAAHIRLEGPEFDPVEAEVALAGDGPAGVCVDLAPAAASVLAPLLEGGGQLPLQLSWSGEVLARMPPVEVIASADVSEVRRRLQTVSLGEQRLVLRSIIEAHAHIEIRGSTDDALEAALRDGVLAQLQKRFAQGGELAVRAAASEVLPWPVMLATTLDDFMPSTSRHALVERIVLDAADIGQLPPTEVGVLARFGAGLERVNVGLAGLAPGSASGELSFSDGTLQRLRLGTLDFRWRQRLKRTGRPPENWSEWREVRGRSALRVPVQWTAAGSLEILTTGIDFETRWASVRVTLSHRQGSAAPALTTLELDARQPNARWSAAPGSEPGVLTGSAQFVSRQGAVIEQTAVVLEPDSWVLTDPCAHEHLRVGLLPAGNGWGEVAQAMVDLRHEDGDHVVEETLELQKLDDYVEWDVPVRAQAPRALQWRLHASYRDGRFESGAWQRSEARVIVVRIDGAARRDVQVLPIYFDPKAVRSGQLRFVSGATEQSLEISDASSRRVALPAGPFSWSLQWTVPDGTQLAATAAVAGEDVIVLPRLKER